MPLLAVNYHQIFDSDVTSEKLNGLSVDLFLKQLSYLRKHFELIGLNDLENIKINKQNYCLITFDDGLACHYKIVFELMKNYNFPAAFFVSGSNVKDGIVTQIHKFQYIRSQLDSADIANELDNYFIENNIKISEEMVSEKTIRKRYRYDAFKTAKTKFIINYFLDANHRNHFVNKLFENLIKDEESFVNDWYITNDQIREMHSIFSCIGSHALSHDPLAKMKEKDVFYELVETKRILEELTLKEISTISYPLGNLGAVGSREGKKAEQAGYKFGFTMEREWNNTLNFPLMLARIDCNDLPKVGKSPLFDLNNSKLYKKNGILSKRSLFN